MKSTVERRERQDCPAMVTARLKISGGLNRFGGPLFRVVWGWNRLIKMHGQWEEHKPAEYKSTGIVDAQGREFVSVKPPSVKNCVIETREVPKYLPANCWHLEGWCPPEQYGSPETWGKMGEEVIGCMTIDTAGEFPSHGEYELIMPLTDDGTPQGKVMKLEPAVVEMIVLVVKRSRDFSFAQRRAAIMQREERKENLRVDRYVDILRDGCQAFSGKTFVTQSGRVQ